MNIGAIILVIYLISLFSKKKEGAGAASKNLALGQEISYRAVILSVLMVTAFFAGAFFLAEATQPYLVRIGSEWVREIVSVAVCFLCPIVMLCCGPPWLAWRVLRHLRHPLPARFVFWFTPGIKKPALAGFARLVVASYGRHPLPPEQPPPALRKKLRVFFMMNEKGPGRDLDAWTIAALALHAEISGDPRKAQLFLTSFEQLGRSLVPRLVRIYAFELLALHAARRGDWRRVAHLAASGTGRSMLLLRTLASGHLTGRANWPLLLLAWGIAPCRIAAFRHLRALIAQRGATDAQSAMEAPPETFQVAHLRLLRDAAEGKPVGLRNVLGLASAWQTKLTAESHAAILARGMEVGARDAHGAAEAIPESLLAELEELAAGGAGGLPEEMVENWEKWRDTLAGEVVMRLRNRLFKRAEDAALLFFDENAEQAPPLLECWERWLAMRDATERLGFLMGMDDVATIWYGGLRLNAWNGACRVFNTYGKESAWIGQLMFSWVVTIAEKLGDEDAVEVNRRNAAACGLPGVTTREALIALSRRVGGRLREGIKRACSAAWWRRAVPCFGQNTHKAVLNHITVVLPLGGTIVIVTILSSIWSFGDVFFATLLGLAVAASGFALLYVLALRIEKKVRQGVGKPS